MTAEEHLRLAQKHLSKVQVAWLDPVDWADLSIYGFLAIENAVVAAAGRLGIPVQKTHQSKTQAARELAKDHGFPDIADLMLQLWDMRQSESYGDVQAPEELDPEDVARDIEELVETARAAVETK